MMPVFPIDQIRQRCRTRARAKRPSWEKMRRAFPTAAVPDRDTLYALATKD